MQLSMDIVIFIVIFSFITGTILNIKERKQIKQRKNNINDDRTLRIDSLQELKDVVDYNKLIEEEKEENINVVTYEEMMDEEII